MERIFTGKVFAPSSVMEHVEFNSDRPYTISIKHFMEDDIAPPHYSDSIEILVCDNLKGTVIIDANQYKFKGKQVFYIPPQYIHSVIIERCDGEMYVLKISLESLSEFINIVNIIEYKGFTLFDNIFVCDEFESLHTSILQLIKNDADIFARIKGIVDVFQKLSGYFMNNNIVVEKNNKDRSNLKKLIDWSIDNHGININLEQAAQYVGYSKYYFCRWFKKVTGITFKNYLIHLKIEYACKLLAMHKTVSETSSLCGYENISYFIRLFSKVKYCTPKQYYTKYKKK